MRKIASLAALSLVAVLLVPGMASADPGDTVEQVVVKSDADGTDIAITVAKPAEASTSAPVPVILHSHGWGGSRTTTLSGDVAAFVNAGFGVVSIDQRGFGASGGEANVEDPDLEAEDIDSVIDYVATLDWVALNEDNNGDPIVGDPVLGAVGGSYGGGYQTMAAFDETQEEGSTRFDAIIPEITWYDLNESLAPQGVPRTAWTTALYAAGASALPQYVHEGFAWGAATSLWPDGTILGQANENVPDLDSEFHEHGPVAFVERGVLLDIPMLLRQGSSDNLFNLNQGLHIFNKGLTPAAQSESLFVGYNGGHALPNAFPLGKASGTDSCSGDWTALRVAFFRAVFDNDPATNPGSLLPSRYNVTDVNGKCLRYDTTGATKIAVNESLDPTGSNAMISTLGLGAPIHIPLDTGAIKIAGIPTLSGDVYSLTPEARVFFGLAIGTTPADAQVIQNNLMPLRQVLMIPNVGQSFEIELPGVAADVPEGQSLFLTITPTSDMFAGHGSRIPGGMLLTDLELTLPTH